MVRAVISERPDGVEPVLVRGAGRERRRRPRAVVSCHVVEAPAVVRPLDLAAYRNADDARAEDVVEDRDVRVGGRLVGVRERRREHHHEHDQERDECRNPRPPHALADDSTRAEARVRASGRHAARVPSQSVTAPSQRAGASSCGT